VPIDAYRAGDFSSAITALKAGGQILTQPGTAGSTDVLGRTLIANTIYDPLTIRTLASGQTVADPFSGNKIPLAQLDKVALAQQKFIPEPNLPGFINNYLPTYPSTRHSTIPAVKLVIDSILAPELIGRDVTSREKSMLDLQKTFHVFGRSGAFIYGLSAIDIALWDIAGKAANQPVYQLLGGSEATSLEHEGRC